MFTGRPQRRPGGGALKGTAVCVALLAGAAAAAAAPAPPAPVPAQRLWREECGSCHVAYPAAALPAPKWRAIMRSLERHFGVDASLQPADVRRIGAWLEANAGAGRARDAGAGSLRITETRWFRSEHDEIPASVWRGPAVSSAANCGACHPRATEGNFNEDDVRLPR